jgi:hypothetical protein
MSQNALTIAAHIARQKHSGLSMTDNQEFALQHFCLEPHQKFSGESTATLLIQTSQQIVFSARLLRNSSKTTSIHQTLAPR